MGCSPTQNLAIEETFITQQQLRLGFSKVDAADIDMAVRKYSFHNCINPSQLAMIEEQLDLSLHNTGDWPEVSSMMSSLQNSIGWDSRSLIILGVLCSSSKPQTKATVLFEIYDQSHIGILLAVEIETLLKKMCELACQALGSLLSEDQKTAYKIDQYLHKCTASTDRVVRNLMKRFKASITKTAFIKTLTTLHYGFLMSASGLRNYLHVEYSRNGPGRDFTNINLVRPRVCSLGSIAEKLQDKGEEAKIFESSSTDECEQRSLGRSSSLD